MRNYFDDKYDIYLHFNMAKVSKFMTNAMLNFHASLLKFG